MSTISFVVAMGRNRVIGRDNRLPWRMPADMQRFRKLTMGKAVLMGRQTYESIGKPLVGRDNIVLTRDASFRVDGCTIVHSIEEALQGAGEGEIMVIGGAQIFAQMLGMADRIYLTLIDADFEGDIFFPPMESGTWREMSREVCPADDANPYDYTFILLVRRVSD